MGEGAIEGARAHTRNLAIDLTELLLPFVDVR